MKPNTDLVTAFFSWQSDSPPKTNRNFIEKAIKNGIKTVGAPDSSLSVCIDRDTQHVPGSPDIAAKIFEKIDQCQFFICDISVINPGVSGRKCPNPNVLLELGYAIYRLGWDRIICVLNEEYGNPEELPFDLRGRRLCVYTYYHDDIEKRKRAEEKISKAVEATILLIHHDPDFRIIPPKRLSGPQQEKRARDIRMISAVMESINSHAIKEFYFESISGRITDDIFYYWYDFDAIYSSPAFFIYDEKLRSIIDLFRHHWDKALGYGHLFEPANKGGFKPIRYAAIHNRSELQECYVHIDEAYRCFTLLCSYINSSFIEIDISNTDRIASRKNSQDMKDIALTLSQIEGIENERLLPRLK